MNNLNDQEIVKLYCEKNLTQLQISKLFNVTQSCIYLHLKKNKIKCRNNRKYLVNEFIVDNLLSEDILYFIGFFVADGYHNEKEKRLSISITSKDIEILNHFNKLFYDGKHPIKIYDYKRKNRNNKPVAVLDIFSSKISKIFKNIGIRQKKSFTCGIPKLNIPDKLFHHFVRGLFDGDGCIYKSKKQNSYTIYLIGNNIISKQLKIRFKKFGFKFKEKIHKKSKNKMTYLILGKNENVKDFLEWMYKDSNFYLNRKFKKYEDLCNFLK